jgi:hypothetical protein
VTVRNQWRPAHEGEERIDYDCGIALVLYRERGLPGGELLWRIAGGSHATLRTGTTDIVEGRKRAMRAADLLLRQAIEQNAAALILQGTGMNT